MSGIFIHPKTGNVGIGLTNPRTALEVNGTITASNISVIGDFVRLNTVTSNTEQMVIENAGTGPALKVTQTGANSIAEFYDDGNVLALKIADGGNIGIGTGIPMAKLEVNVAPVLVGGDPTYRGDIRIVSQGGGSILNSTGGIEFKISNSGPGYGWRINAPDATGTNEGTPLSIQSRIGSATWTNNLIIKGDGNVGIGTTNPVAKLHIQGDVYYTGSILRNGQSRPFVRYCAPTNTSGRMNFATKTHDTHNAVTIGSSWKFTVPSNCSGYYIVAVALHFQGTNLAELYKVVGGVAALYCRIVQQSVQYMSNGSTTIYLNAGEDIYIYSQAISNTVDIYNYVDIACLELRAA